MVLEIIILYQWKISTFQYCRKLTITVLYITIIIPSEDWTQLSQIARRPLNMHVHPHSLHLECPLLCSSINCLAWWMSPGVHIWAADYRIPNQIWKSEVDISVSGLLIHLFVQNRVPIDVRNYRLELWTLTLGRHMILKINCHIWYFSLNWYV